MDSTKKIDAEADRQALEKLIVARISLLWQNPFFGNIATRLILENADDWCPTAGTDGRKLYYNSEFVNKLTQKEVIFLVGHELFHVLYEHVGLNGRRGTRNATIWNIAGDYAINLDLVENKIGDKIKTVPILYDTKYKGKSAEEIYQELVNNAEKISISQMSEMVLDEHLDGDDDGSCDGGKGGEGDKKEGKGRPAKLTDEEKRELADDIKEAMLAAAQAVGIGNVPAGFRRYLKELTEPQIDWKEYLTQQIESQIKNDFTFNKIGRRSWSMDAILPAMQKEPTIQCTIAVDLSGSIGEVEMRDFFSEIKGICDQYASYSITLLTWDTNCYFVGEFTEDDGIDAMVQAELKGGGGTDPTCIWEWCDAESHEPKQLVIFTDGFVSRWGDEYADKYPTTWLMYKNKSAVATHGTSVYYE